MSRCCRWPRKNNLPWEKTELATTPTSYRSQAERENRLLIGIAAGVGCLLIACLLIALLIGGLAIIWTLQGQLGPGSSLLLPGPLA